MEIVTGDATWTFLHFILRKMEKALSKPEEFAKLIASLTVTTMKPGEEGAGGGGQGVSHNLL